MKKLLTDPLFHFLLVGAALFIIFELYSNTGESFEDKILITQGNITALESNFARTWQRPPTEKELLGLIEESVRDEIAYREAVKMGLDQNDSYIKRRLRMKMELLIEDIGTLEPPSERELLDYLENNREAFRKEPKVGFSHVYLNVEKRANTLEEDVRMLLQQLNGIGSEANPENFGDAIMLPKHYPLSSLNIIARQFGSNFADDIAGLRPGSWHGPIESSYGLHLVLIHESVAGRDPDLSEIRPAVEREYVAKRQREIKEEAYQKLKEQYPVEIDRDQDSGV